MRTASAVRAAIAAVLVHGVPALAQEGRTDPETERLLREAEQEAPVPPPPRPGEAPAAASSSPSALNPRLTAFVDFLARTSFRGNDLWVEGEEDADGNGLPDPVNVDDRASVREAELDLRAAVDPYASGVLILAIAEELPGEYVAEVEEAYGLLHGLPGGTWIPGLSVTIGRFRTALGRANTIHGHDLPWATAPYAFQALLGEEGDVESGVSLDWLGPAWGSLSWRVIAQGVNGENETLLAGSGSDFPAGIAALRGFLDLGTVLLDAGASGLLGYQDPDNRQRARLAVLDLTLKWRPDRGGDKTSLVVGGELFLCDRDDPAGTHERLRSAGAYAFAQVQLWTRWYFGLRYDWTRYPDDPGERESSVGGWISYYTTEFLRFRIGYENRQRPGDTDLDTIYVQATLVIGSHPAEPYWVNR